MIRQTSAIAYREIQAEGILSDLQKLVLKSLAENGPCTASELMEKAHAQHPDWTISMISNFEKRLSELRAAGVARELPRRRCSVSGRTAIVWEASSAGGFDESGQGTLFPTAGTYMRGH